MTTELEDVYQVLAGRRAEAPVRARPAGQAVGMGAGFDVYGYDECARVLREPRTFSSAASYEENANRVFGRTIIGMDDPEHKRHRDLVASCSTGSRARRRRVRVRVERGGVRSSAIPGTSGGA